MELAEMVVACLASRGINPRSIVEPTCGIGNFLVAATERFPNADNVFGLDINNEYINEARSRVPRAQMISGQVFDYDWNSLIKSLPESVLIVGNPPWVTSSGLSARGATNLPAKTNSQGHRGLDAKTGKANFDIAEWIATRLIEAAGSREVTLALLLKTAVARKILRHVWTHAQMREAAIYEIDAARYFGVSVAACLLVVEMGQEGHRPGSVPVHPDLAAKRADHHIGWEEGYLIADANAREITRHLQVTSDAAVLHRWRSGVKHDCSKVMEFRGEQGRLVNGLGEKVDLESDHIFPLMKGSDVAQGREPTRWMLVPQRRTGDDTKWLRESAPKTWAYLEAHGEALDRRKSSIYRNRPRFSVFGIGDYTFAPWKVAICGLYKKLGFRVVGPFDGEVVVFDDTVYQLSFESEERARDVEKLLTSDLGLAFFRALIFWDNKRPITAEILNRLDLIVLGSEMGIQVGERAEAATLFG